MDLCSSKNVFYLFSLLSLITLSMLFSFSSLSELWKVPERHIIAPVSLPRYFAEHRCLPLICKITFFSTHVHYTTFTQIELYLSILFPRYSFAVSLGQPLQPQTFDLRISELYFQQNLSCILRNFFTKRIG